MDSSALSWLAGLSLGASLVVAVGAQNTFVLQQGLRREHVGAVVAICLGLGYGARLLAPLFERPVAWRWLDGGVALTMGTLGWRLAAGLLRG